MHTQIFKRNTHSLKKREIVVALRVGVAALTLGKGKHKETKTEI